jgi:hypothetical protein
MPRIDWRPVLLFLAVAPVWWTITLLAQCGRAPCPSEFTLTGPDESALAGLPNVERVDVPVRPHRPTQRIIQLVDWHFVPPALFAQDMRAASPAPLTDADVAGLYAQHLRTVEAVQAEQLAVLRHLAREHGLKRVFVEGLTPEGERAYRIHAEALVAWERDELPGLRQEVAEAENLAKKQGAAGELAKAIAAQTRDMIEAQQHDLLNLGAPARLLAAGELAEVLALDEDGALEGAAPRTASRKLRLPPAAMKAHEDAMVKRLAGHPLAVVVLGGAHDLSASVKALAPGAEYLRVVPRAYHNAPR